jgi:hypothetical protein
MNNDALADASPHLIAAWAYSLTKAPAQDQKLNHRLEGARIGACRPHPDGFRRSRITGHHHRVSPFSAHRMRPELTGKRQVQGQA